VVFLFFNITIILFVKTFGEQVLEFYQNLGSGPTVPQGVEVLHPYMNSTVWRVMNQFYSKYYSDHHPRVFLIGINPGRLGAGTTGIPFTDPIRLNEACGIDNNFKPIPELSSRFIYHMIEAFGGTSKFYKNFYFTSVSPLGFTRLGKNLNYYDLMELQNAWEPFMVSCLRSQLKLGACPRAFSLGQGKNYKYLQFLNDKYRLFDQVIPLPHPRWIMQYRLKRLNEFVSDYCSKLSQIIA